MNNELNFQLHHECHGKHKHDFPQILIPLEQTMHITINKEEYEVTKRELCFIPRGMTHQCEFWGQIMVVNLSEISLEWRDTIEQAYPMIVELRDQVMRLVEMIIAELKADPKSKAVQHLYSYLYSKLVENCGAPSIRYIREFYHMPITIEQLARIENYDSTYYTDWFKQQTGVPPGMYLRNVRIDRAKELLRNSNLSIMQIASMVGYSSNATLTRAFHHTTGMTPKEYRESTCLRAAN